MGVRALGNSLSSHSTRESQSTRRADRQRALTCCIAACFAVLGACTLTQDDFEPSPLQRSALTPDGAGGAGAMSPAPIERVACTDTSDCSAGLVCGAGVCLVSSCVGAEDINACEIEACLDGACADAACGDGEASAGESDVDCGGPCGP